MKFSGATRTQAPPLGCATSSSISGRRASICPTRWSSTSLRWRAGSSTAQSRRRATRPATIPADAVLAERPIYKGGQILRAWQKRFVQTCVEDHKLHGKARYLLADDVGLGKTLSMAAAALVLSLLDDKPVLILAPATLIWQWQEELEDKLGIPAAVWSTQKKCWLDGERRPLTQKGDPELLQNAPGASGSCRRGLSSTAMTRASAARWPRNRSAS